MRAPLTLLASLILAAPLIGARAEADAGDAPPPAAAMARAAGDLLALLTPEQRKLALLDFEHAGRRRWRATPGRRVGLAWGRLGATQRLAAEKLLRTGLSTAGMRRFRGVMTLEGVLRVQARAQVRRDPSWRDPGLYWIAVFGVPSATGVWSWRIGGHHYSRHFTCVRGRVSATPGFHGANPAGVPRGPNRGLRVMAREEDAARALVASLDGKQRARAVLPQAPRDFVPYAPRQLGRLPGGGLRLLDLGEAQRARVWALIGIWVGVLHPQLAARVLAEARAGRPEEIRFAWMGSALPGRSHGYRLHGPTFFFEYWHAGNHVHAVWRDPVNEHGAADLARPR